mgnify:CR=1 FL=1
MSVRVLAWSRRDFGCAYREDDQLSMRRITYTDDQSLLEALQRSSYDYSKIEKIVQPILDKVKRGGDKALKKFALDIS